MDRKALKKQLEIAKEKGDKRLIDAIKKRLEAFDKDIKK